jgi:hypothetical protein
MDRSVGGGAVRGSKCPLSKEDPLLVPGDSSSVEQELLSSQVKLLSELVSLLLLLAEVVVAVVVVASSV